MMLPADLLGILLALTSACVWGAGDFSGGFASRRNNQFQVLALAALSGIAVLLAAAALRGESLPSPASTLWAMLAGVSGALGLAALYRGLSLGHAASVAPTAAVIGAVLPVAFSGFVEGLPGMARLAGFALACLGIWLVSQTTPQDIAVSRAGFVLACLAGVGFGGFFIFIAQVERGLVFTPLIVTRCITLCVALLLLRMRRLPWGPVTPNPTALVAGVLDAGGNVFYLLAKQFTRLDVAAVLSSLYPASTVLLSCILLKEKVTRTQWFGVAVCLAAIVFITI
jgi:drug/metabolite transporter (DMT)-like permease